MEYLLEMGPHEQTLAKQALRMGQPLPDRIANAPELNRQLEFFLTAFFDLDSERGTGFSIGPIPWSKIQMYAELIPLDDEMAEALHFIIKQLDNAQMKRLEKQSKTKRDG